MFGVKRVSYDVWHALGRAQVAADIGEQVALIRRAPPADGIGFHIMVQIFVRVQLRALWRQQVLLDLRLPLREP